MDPFGIEREKKEAAAKSLEALAKMGLKDLKLTEHESVHPCFCNWIVEFTHSRLNSHHRLRDCAPR